MPLTALPGLSSLWDTAGTNFRDRRARLAVDHLERRRRPRGARARRQRRLERRRQGREHQGEKHCVRFCAFRARVSLFLSRGCVCALRACAAAAAAGRPDGVRRASRARVLRAAERRGPVISSPRAPSAPLHAATPPPQAAGTRAAAGGTAAGSEQDKRAARAPRPNGFEPLRASSTHTSRCCAAQPAASTCASQGGRSRPPPTLWPSRGADLALGYRFRPPLFARARLPARASHRRWSPIGIRRGSSTPHPDSNRGLSSQSRAASQAGPPTPPRGGWRNLGKRRPRARRRHPARNDKTNSPKLSLWPPKRHHPPAHMQSPTTDGKTR